MKKKILSLLALAAAAMTALGVLSACKKEEEHVLTHHDAVAATCTETGAVEYWYCSECGKNFADEAAQEVLSSVTTSALGHDFGAWEVVVSATCTEDGEQKQTCSRCGLENKAPLSAIGHEYGAWTEVYPPTCTETGLEKRTCSRCNAEEEQDIKALGHDFVNMTCTRCGASQMSDRLEFTRNSDGSYTVTGIGKETETEIYIPNSYQGSPVTAIGERAFYGNDDITHIYLNGGVTSIGESAFDGCTSLSYVQISNSVTKIEDRAFFGTALTSVSIPDTVTWIDAQAFGNCLQLTSLTTPRTNTAYQTIDGDLYNKEGTVLIQYAVGKSAKTFSIPAGVETVESTAFFRAYQLEKIAIPASVKVLGDRVFGTCTALEEISVDEKNTVYRSRSGDLYSADSSTFLQYAIGKENSTFLSTDDVKAVAEGAFENAKSLKKVTLSATLTEIGKGAFKGCTALEELVLPDSLLSIGEDAFRGASALKKVTIPASVERIGVGAFRETALESASFAKTQGWVAGGRSLAEESLANASTAATYLTDAYVADEWTRK